MEKKKRIRVIPLGGLGEVGKNITVIEYGEEIIVIDCGMAFPDSDMLGVDVVIPDVSYLVKNKERVKGFFVTHGHEDHIGAFSYILKQINVPIYGTKLTLGLIESKLEEANMLSSATLNLVKPGEIIKLDKLKVEFIRTTHSIADSCALAIHTPLGVIVHTGDFKVDFTPVDGEVIDLGRFAQLGKRGVLLLMADSTNSGHTGYTMSEKTVGETLNNLFSKADSRIIVATFASNIHRLQQIIDSSVRFGRKVAFSGRSMEKISEVAMNLGYLNIPEGTLVDLKDIKLYNSDQITIVTTGSQGEPMSALTRIAAGIHRNIQIEKGDMIIISATPIPGNEKPVSRVINELVKKGANVIYKDIEDIHVSGHACEEELKLMHSIVRPKFFMPVHGEYKHLRKHSLIAQQLGLKKENAFILENGDVLELTRKTARINGKVQVGNVLVDGVGIGDIGNIVLRDRKVLSNDGIINIVIALEKESKEILCGPDIVTRGFVYVRESEELVAEIREIAVRSLQYCIDNRILKWSEIKKYIRNEVGYFIYNKTKRKPIIIPIIMEI